MTEAYIAGDIAPHDAQDLMSWPFFSLAKAKRTASINVRMGEVAIHVEATAEHGMATIWDADILIWIASQIVEARDVGRPTSRLIAAKPHDILTFTQRGTGKASYERLRAGLDGSNPTASQRRFASHCNADGTAFPGSMSGASNWMAKAAR